jgi:CDGSH-type Zn-finger protein
VVASSEAIVAQKGPFAVELRAGRSYAWRACARGSTQPFCAGLHQTTGLPPVVFKAEQDGTAYLCGCKTGRGRPFCDGSHNRL